MMHCSRGRGIAISGIILALQGKAILHIASHPSLSVIIFK